MLKPVQSIVQEQDSGNGSLTARNSTAAPVPAHLLSPSTSPRQSPAVNGLTGSILIVDDEPLNLDMLSRRLRRNGFVVAVADSGREALELVRRQSFDLILLDQMMPQISGAEVLRGIRADYAPDVLPIIMVTAVAESDRIAEALEAGANDYITKPIDFPIALARIRSQLTRKHAGTALRQSEERYALAAQASQDGLWDWNLLNGEVYFSPRWKSMLGIQDQGVENTADAWFSRVLATDRKTVMAIVEQHVQGKGNALQCAYRMLHGDGSVRWMSCRGIITRDLQGHAIRLAGSQSDVTAEKTVDPLTGLPNRLLLLDHLDCALQGASHPGAPAASYGVLFLYLDGFKTINDSLGQLAGDQLLKLISRRLQLVAGEFDPSQTMNIQPMAARMVGYGFAILLTEGATRELVEQLGALVQQAMKVPMDLDGRSVQCAFSIGVALASPAHSGPEDILHDAAIAAYAAKTQGRGEVAFFEVKMQNAATERMDMENDLRLAVERDELVIAYQPKVDLASGLTYGVEALLRWNHPRRGMLQPDAFIHIAEETGAIVEMGKWVLSNACSQVRAWQDIFPMASPLELSVNLSPREFKQQNLVEGIGQILEANDFPPSALHLEITEGVLFEDMEAARSTLNALKQLGVRLDLDDFGTGYSSLKYLRELPFDLIKIDQYFIKSLDPEQPSSGELIQTILAMAENLSMDVVAEGIETLHHIQRLKELGCRLGQGYYFSRPIGAGAMQAFLASQHTVTPATLTTLLASPETATASGPPSLS